MVVVYKLMSGLFVDQGQKAAPAPAAGSACVPAEPVQMGKVTGEELLGYDGSDPCKPLLVAIKGQIYDLSRSRGTLCHMFAGSDASRALALMSFEPKDLTGNTDGLSESELEVLQDWEYNFMEKYVKVGHIVPKGSVSSGRVENLEALDAAENKKTE